MIGKILKSNFFWKFFMLFFIKVFSCYFPLRAFSSWYFPYVLKWKINFSEKSFGRMQNLTEVCWTKMGSKNTFSLSFWALERYFRKNSGARIASKIYSSFLRLLNEAIQKGRNENRYTLYFLMIFAFRPPNRKLPTENLFRIIDISGVSLVRMRFWAT